MISKKIILISVLTFLSFFLISWWGAQNLNFNLLKLNNINNKDITLDNNKKYEVTLIYIGSSSCRFCNSENVQTTYSQIRSNLKYRIKQYGYKFSTIGISKDNVVTEGLIHLNKYGDFDEIMTGNGWSNNGILKYVYGEIPGQAATPQILVTFRKYRSLNIRDNYSIYRGIEEEKLLIRKVGEREITAWGNTTNSSYIPKESLNPF